MAFNAPCGPSSGEVFQYIQNGWDTNRNYATQQYNEMETLIASLSSYLNDIAANAVRTDLQPVLAADQFGAAFNRPDEPPNIDIVYNTPDGIGTATFVPPTPPQLDDRPEFTGQPPTLDFTGAPADFDEEAPPTDITLTSATPPDAPDIASILPSVADLLASLRDITIPPHDPLVIPTWDVVKPTDDTYIPFPSFSYTETDYTSANLTELQTEISRRFSEGSGLPAAFWDAYLERDKLQQEEAALRAEEAVTGLWARNGWDVPTLGESFARNRIRQGTFNQESDRRRETWLKQVDLENESLQFAVTQGIAAESFLTNFHSQQANRSLEAARIAQDVAIQLATLTVTRLNARYNAYATDAQVGKTRLEYELGKLEAWRFDLDEARVKVELNDQEIRVFLAQYEAAKNLIALFNAQIESVKAQNENDKTRVSVLTEQVRTYAEKIRANDIQWGGYGKKVDAQLGKVQSYETEARAYGEIMRGFGIESDSENSRVAAETRIQELNLGRFEADARRFEAETRGESERVSSLARKLEALINLYGSKGQIEEARVRSETNRTAIVLEQLRANESLQLQNAELQINQILRLLDLEKTGLESVLDVRAQLVASLFSAFNLNAGLSGGFENSSICSNTVS